MQIQPNERERILGGGNNGVSISPRPKKESEMFDRYGNVIDPKTKRIIKPAGKE